MTLAPKDLGALRDKYVELLRLRAEHAAPHPPDPRAALVALAARFPGALRELDATPLDELEARLATVERCLEGEPPPPWLVAVHHFHELTRGILATKRWLAAEAPSAFEGALAAGSLPPEAGIWRAHLERIARPPHGRLLALVFDVLAAQLGTTADEARSLVVGPAPSPRSA
jgi:hypothetical protein